MNVREINQALLQGHIDLPGVCPHLEQLKERSFVFPFDFGLPELPRAPGLLMIRGPRQYGKSTWLESQIADTIRAFGPGTCFYLNGDEVTDRVALMAAIREVLPLFSARAPVKRLFIDEITAVRDWELALKRLIDAGELKSVLVVTTGSRATDLRRGTERLPGRKGMLSRTVYHFTPVPYRDFRRICGPALKEDALPSYLLSGGSPMALNLLADHHRLPEFLIGAVRDWIDGECARSGRSHASLVAVMEGLHRQGGSPVGQAKLAREAGLANNTVAMGYLELLADLSVIGHVDVWDPERSVRLLRKPSKFAFINLLAACAWDRDRLRAPSDFRGLDMERQGVWMEWMVAQELWRRRAKAGADAPERLLYLRDAHHEIDFVASDDLFVEVKRGHASAMEFAWFPRRYPGARLIVVGRETFRSDSVKGVTLEDFLLNEDLEALWADHRPPGSP